MRRSNHPEVAFHRDFSQGYVVEESGCWNWIGYKTEKGYGKLSVPGKSPNRAHRFSYEHHVGTIPHGMHVLHECDNPSCVNPRHLFLGTNRKNMDDKLAKGRQLHGTQVKKSKITEEMARKIYLSSGTQRNIAKMFGISQSDVSRIKGGHIWGRVTAGLRTEKGYTDD